MKWIKHGDIQASVKGSDHCPIYVDFYEEITLESGETVKLRDAMRLSGDARDLAPRIAAKNWEEFSGKQTLLSTFFGKKGCTGGDSSSGLGPGPSIRPTPTPLTTSLDASKALTHTAPTSRTSNSTKKRPLSHTNSSTPGKKKAKKDSTQPTLSSFFSKPKPPQRSIEIDEDVQTSSQKDTDRQDQLEADYRLACELAASQQEEEEEEEASSSSTPSENKTAWSTLFTPTQPPKCTTHREPAKRYTVNKPGVNKGRMFYVCSRCVLAVLPVGDFFLFV